MPEAASCYRILEAFSIIYTRSSFTSSARVITATPCRYVHHLLFSPPRRSHHCTLFAHLDSKDTCYEFYLTCLTGTSQCSRISTRRKMALENIIQPEYDDYSILTRGARFHADHTNLCIGVMQIMTGESSEIFCSCLVGGRDPVGVRKGGLNQRVWCIILRNVAEGVTF